MAPWGLLSGEMAYPRLKGNGPVVPPRDFLSCNGFANGDRQRGDISGASSSDQAS